MSETKRNLIETEREFQGENYLEKFSNTQAFKRLKHKISRNRKKERKFKKNQD
jgi:hypothetical protein